MNIQKIPLYIISFGILVSGLIFSISFAQTATDINDADIQYPIAELGNCQNKNACKTYCDKSANTSSCIAFAEKNNLMTANEINNAKKFINAGVKGPGECTTKNSCEAYCDDINHINECIAYAEKTGILSPQELEEAKQVQSAIAKGVKPPPCKNKKECDVYCENPSNMKVCVAFGEAAGFLKGKELEDVKKMMTAIDKGAIPPPCKGKEACDTYCSQPDNMEVCMNFAQAAGFMTPEEAEGSQKVLNAIKKGVKPPACKGKDECDKYCSEDSHIEECIAFSVAAGFMSEKDAEMAKKTGGKGPGGCKGKDECDAFCKNPENQETCFNFGKENGLISPEQLKEMEEGNRFQPGPGMENPGGQMMPPQAGPGGCKTPEECKTFCEGNPEACKNFGQQNGPQGMPPSGEKQFPNSNMQPRQIRPMMPSQGMENQPNEYPGENMQFREIREGMPLNQNLPFNEMMPPNGTFSPEGNMQLPPSGIQQMMPQGGGMLPQDFNPNPQPGTVPQTEPGSFNPPPPTSMLLQFIANVLFSL